MNCKVISRLTKIDKFIASKNTGTPIELGNKMHLSERCIRNYIAILKELGAPIACSRKFKSYYYKEERYFHFKFINYNDNK